MQKSRVRWIVALQPSGTRAQASCQCCREMIAVDTPRLWRSDLSKSRRSYYHPGCASPAHLSRLQVQGSIPDDIIQHIMAATGLEEDALHGPADESMGPDTDGGDIHMGSASQEAPLGTEGDDEEWQHPLDADELRNLSWWDSPPHDMFRDSVASLLDVPGSLVLGIAQAREAVAEAILAASSRPEELRAWRLFLGSSACSSVTCETAAPTIFQ